MIFLFYREKVYLNNYLLKYDSHHVQSKQCLTGRLLSLVARSTGNYHGRSLRKVPMEQVPIAHFKIAD